MKPLLSLLPSTLPVVATRERISLVIPCHNDAPFLKACLLSASQQTRPFDEVIVVDNNSTDDTADVARHFGARVIRETRPGVTAASSAGFDAATGTIIARCDADSRLPTTWAADVENKLRDSPKIAVTGPARFYDVGPFWHFVARVFYLRPYFVINRAMFGHEFLFGSNCAVRTTAWRSVSSEIPRDDPRIHDDLDLSLRLAKIGQAEHATDLMVTISARPLRSASSMAYRLIRAGHTYRRFRRDRRQQLAVAAK